MRISIIVPIYNIERFLGLCVESLIRQTYRDLEIILVDDGSPDQCPELCDLYAKKDSRIKVIHKTNGGLVSARKAGLQAATGELIGYVDGDDWVEPEFYESLYNTMTATGADIVCAGMSRDLFSKREIFQNVLPAGVYTDQHKVFFNSNMISYGAFYQPGIMTYVWNKLFKTHTLYDAQMNVDERISTGEDAAITYPALQHCGTVCVTDNCQYHYRQRQDSMLKSITSFQTDAEKLRYLWKYLSNFAERHDIFNLQSQIDDYVLSLCVIRSGGVIGGVDQPFDVDCSGKKIVVYSAGTFGQQLMNRLKESGHCEVVAWVDDDYWEYRRCCLDVDPIENIGNLDFDYVLLATVNGMLSEKIKTRLQILGIS